MPTFLTTLGTANRIEEIIQRAQSRLVLISPYLKIPEILSQRLQDAEKRGVKISLVYGKEQLQQGQLTQLSELKSLSLYYLENLRAKCYLNEQTMIICSMNLHEFSVQNNREMGILLSQEHDRKAFQDALKEVQSIIAAAEQQTIQILEPPGHETSRPIKPLNSRTGICIRCGEGIPFNPEHPLCRGCYEEWAQWENEEYEENYCHKCGRQALTTKAKPLCYPCYSSA